MSNVDSPGDFEQHILSIIGMNGMKEILFCEPGRTAVEGTRFVFHTNTLIKTGGSLQFGMFHTENYLVPDVPRYISFVCEVPGRFGGETGLVNTAKVYADLSDRLQRKLEHGTCLVSLYSLAEMIRRYRLRPEIINEFCDNANLPMITFAGSRYVAIYKPSVVQHPVTKERSLLVNFGCIPLLQEALISAFRADYSSPQWLLHRLSWKAPSLTRFAFRKSYEALRERGNIHAIGAPLLTEACCLAKLFLPEDVPTLAASMRCHYSSFLWKRGDILIVDNLVLAHNGMAGLGKRELKVTMCNPVRLPTSSASPGLYVVPLADDARECLGTQLGRYYD